MRLNVDPHPPLSIFDEELELVICVEGEAIPQIHVEEGMPKPDRHLLLGLIQSVALAVSEKDSELVAFMDARSIALETGTARKELPQGLVIIRTGAGAFGVLTTADSTNARAMARQAVRWFTGTIRLDVP